MLLEKHLIAFFSQIVIAIRFSAHLFKSEASVQYKLGNRFEININMSYRQKLVVTQGVRHEFVKSLTQQCQCWFTHSALTHKLICIVSICDLRLITQSYTIVCGNIGFEPWFCPEQTSVILHI